MKYKVLKPFSRMSEGGKQYKAGDSVDLNKEHSEFYLDNGYVEKVKAAAKKK